MRAVPATAVALALVCASQAGGHPGHGPGQVVIADNSFSPERITVAAGDTVIWFWDGPDTNHSVTSEDDQGERFDSDPGESAVQVRHRRNDSYAHRFDELGTYDYSCKVHPSMRGTVIVRRPPPRDETPPRLSRLAVTPNPAERRARVRFRVSEASFVVLSVRRAGGRKEVASASAFVRRGERSVRLSVRRLSPGRYRARLVAEDNAANRSRARSVGFRVARG